MKKIFLLLTMFSIIACKNKISPKVINIVKPLKSYTSFHTLDTMPTFIFKKLEGEANEDELETLIYNGGNPYVKAIAIEVLMKKDNDYTFEIFDKTLNSTDSIIFRTECLRDKSSIPGFIFSNATFPNEYLSAKQAEINKAKLFDILFSQNQINVKLVDELFLWIPNSEEYYLKIREAIIANRSKYLLQALAKFKKKQDVELIKSFGKDAFIAIRQFPDNEFLIMFEKYKSEENTFNYKSAKVQYQMHDSI